MLLLGRLDGVQAREHAVVLHCRHVLRAPSGTRLGDQPRRPLGGETRSATGVRIDGWAAFLIGSAVLGIANAVLKPLLALLTLPLIIITLGFFYLLINIAMVGLAEWIAPDFSIDGFWAYVGTVVVVWAVNWIGDQVLGDLESRARPRMVSSTSPSGSSQGQPLSSPSVTVTVTLLPVSDELHGYLLPRWRSARTETSTSAVGVGWPFTSRMTSPGLIPLLPQGLQARSRRRARRRRRSSPRGHLRYARPDLTT